ncbi:Uncharacterized protein PCOAH_00020640 [Plasmodium coatneyi]|uniref:Uncharacterized protein n=1 Tax=Plasmodium coatneyi TaxID=208452 RepID=A0A1B1DY33_9APIC|nr:Uncharacterized protein PCOAH_00020640 [Plasmodium coatneyi]ANQ07721.1 Uncharacterized protein PCOAH_00020640 [Plasmodium coatneyi]
MGGNMCVFQRKKYEEEKKELALRKASRRVIRKDAIVNEITHEGVMKHRGEGTNQLGKTNEKREKSILSVPSTSTNNDSVESEEVTTDTSFLTSSSIIRSNIKANIIWEKCLPQNSYDNTCDFTRGHRRGRSFPPLGEANKITLNKSVSFGGTALQRQENFLDLSELIWTKEKDAHQENYLRGGTNYATKKSHSERREAFSAGGGGDPLDGGISTRNEHKPTAKGGSTLADPSRNEDNSSSVKPTKWEKRGKSLDFPSWDHNADYKLGRVPLTKCNSSYFNNRGVIIYS